MHASKSTLPKTTPMHSRKGNGVSVDLYWTPDNLEQPFRVEVIDEHTEADFTLYPLTGEEAIHAFHHPFVAANNQLKAGRIKLAA